MNISSLFAVALAAGVAATAAAAQEENDIGRQEYMVACAGCHGESAKGDGPLADLLNIHTPDLTRLAERQNGTFPYEYTVWMIDGRKIIRAHGASMPIWGDRYMASADTAEAASEPPEAMELVVRGRILALVDYLSSIQE
ncbi:c-type cytochrome [Roseovarius salis]|uniref:c-type cytochrome n=1 Tax=Roseovarius salis TaxID=3376063 RepID=UPI0037CBD34A